MAVEEVERTWDPHAQGGVPKRGCQAPPVCVVEREWGSERRRVWVSWRGKRRGWVGMKDEAAGPLACATWGDQTP